MPSTIKLIILDLHGVILNGDYWNVSRKISRDYNLDLQKVYNAFYKQHNLAALKKILGTQVFPRGIKNLGIKENPQKAWKFHLHATSRRNDSVIAYAQVLRRRGYTVIGLSKSFPELFNGNMKYSEMMERKEFDDVINSYDLNLPKASKKTIQVLMKKFNIKNPNEIIYIDDQDSNLKDPREMGVRTHLYQNFKDMRKWVNNIL